MDRPEWAKKLSDRKVAQIERIIKSIPGFSSYISCRGTGDMIDMAQEYALCLSYGNLLTVGIQTNLELICELIRTNQSLGPVSVDNWEPKPEWAKDFNKLVIDYFDHFIFQVHGLPAFLKTHSDEVNLTKLIIQFQKENHISSGTESHDGIVLGIIKERFNRILSEKENGIHLVDHNLILDDSRIINQFLSEAETNFFKVNLDNYDCKSFLDRYLTEFNPYIGFVIAERLLRFDRVDDALPFVKQISSFIFASPNVYWNNKESIYACAIISYTLVELLGQEKILKLNQESPEIVIKLLQSTYLLLSRIIYWNDIENSGSEIYYEKALPINVQHKLRAYQSRSELLLQFSSYLPTDIPKIDYYVMGIADMWSAHILAYKYNIVGEESLFKQRVFNLYQSVDTTYFTNVHEAINYGQIKLDQASQRFYKSYREGKYFLDYRAIENFFNKRQFFCNTKDLSSSPIIQIDMSKVSSLNNSISYKKDYLEIKEFLDSKGIKYFYHFTETGRLESIIRHGGILSYKQCLDKNIVMPVTDDMAKTRDIDAKKGLEDFARLSFCKYLPKIEIRKQRSKDLVLLKISTEVALFESTEFSDIEATQENMSHGPRLEDLKKVKIDVTQRDFCDEKDPNYWAYQAEILVKSKIPSRCILNIENPEIL